MYFVHIKRQKLYRKYNIIIPPYFYLFHLITSLVVLVTSFSFSLFSLIMEGISIYSIILILSHSCPPVYDRFREIWMECYNESLHNAPKINILRLSVRYSSYRKTISEVPSHSPIFLENVVQSYSYDVYGTPYVVTGVGFTQVKDFIGNLHGNDRLYTDVNEKEINLYYYRARFYDPVKGRFISRDPIGMSDDVNLYGYVKNSPMMGVDPMGLNSKPII